MLCMSSSGMSPSSIGVLLRSRSPDYLYLVLDHRSHLASDIATQPEYSCNTYRENMAVGKQLTPKMYTPSVHSLPPDLSSLFKEGTVQSLKRTYKYSSH